MPFIQWSREFELGIHEFDEHHKHLVNVLNLTYEGFIGDASRDELGAVLDELVDYATFHFAAEENWMRENAYPGLPLQREEHDTFSRRVAEIQENFHNGEDTISIEVLQFLTAWLVDHILRTDAKLGLFAKGLPQAMA